MFCAVQPALCPKRRERDFHYLTDDQRNPGAGYSLKLKQQGPIRARMTCKSLLRFLFWFPASVFCFKVPWAPQFGWGRGCRWLHPAPQLQPSSEMEMGLPRLDSRGTSCSSHLH